MEFIFDSHLKAAAAGHFSSDYLHPHTHAGLRQQLADSVTHQRCASVSGRVASRIYVLENGNATVGFCWVRESPSPRGPRQEIYAVYVAPSHRGQGIAPRLVAHALAQVPKGTDCFARLFPASVVMQKVFLGMGFELEQLAPSQTISMRLAPARAGASKAATAKGKLLKWLKRMPARWAVRW